MTYLVLCGESEEDLRAIVGRFIEVCRRVLNNLVRWGCLHKWTRLEHVSEFKYLGCVLNESGSDEEECSRKVAIGRRAAGAIRSLVNARNL